MYGLQHVHTGTKRRALIAPEGNAFLRASFANLGITAAVKDSRQLRVGSATSVSCTCPLRMERLALGLDPSRPGGPSAKRQPSPEGLGCNPSRSKRHRRGTHLLLNQSAAIEQRHRFLLPNTLHGDSCLEAGSHAYSLAPYDKGLHFLHTKYNLSEWVEGRLRLVSMTVTLRKCTFKAVTILPVGKAAS
jgi:hypothetical protein